MFYDMQARDHRGNVCKVEHTREKKMRKAAVRGGRL